MPDTEACEKAAVPPWPHRRIDVDGLGLSCIDHGPTDPVRASAAGALPLVLIHGAQGNWSHWRANIEELARTHRVLVPDLPGFGCSDAIPRAGLADLATAIEKLTQALAIERVALAAYSFGSLVAAQLAGAVPGLVDRLVLINPPGWRERSPDMVALQVQAAVRSQEQGLRAGIEFTLREIMLCNHGAIDAACLDASEMAVRSMRLRTKDISRSVDLFALLERVSCAWHVIFSSDDPYHRFKLAERRRRLDLFMGKPCTTEVRNARHWVQQDQPEVMNGLLTHFAQNRENTLAFPDLA